MKRFVCAAGIALLCMLGFNSANSQEPDEFMVGPVSYQQDVNGVSVTINARTYFKIHTGGNQITLKARVLADLGDLQRK
jgi:hypothetical protein